MSVDQHNKTPKRQKKIDLREYKRCQSSVNAKKDKHYRVKDGNASVSNNEKRFDVSVKGAVPEDLDQISVDPDETEMT